MRACVRVFYRPACERRVLLLLFFRIAPGGAKEPNFCSEKAPVS